MLIDPAVVTVVMAMANAGWTGGQIASALAAAAAHETRSETHETRSETFHETVKQSSTVPQQTSTERVRRHRAAKQMKREDVSTGVSPVSPLSLDLSLLGTNSNQAILPMTADWQPDDKSRAVATAELGEAQARGSTANFKDYFGARPHDMRSPAEWQADYRKWVRKDALASRAGAQGRLPLVRRARDGPSTAWRTQKAIGETLQRRESG